MFVNPHDDVSLLRIANVPARGLSDVTMERLLAASQERKCSVFAAMNNPAVKRYLSRPHPRGYGIVRRPGARKPAPRSSPILASGTAPDLGRTVSGRNRLYR